MMFQRFLLKSYYWIFKKDIFSSLETLKGHKRITKDILGIYITSNLNFRSLIKSFTKGIGEGFYVFFYFTSRQIPKQKIKLIKELTNIYITDKNVYVPDLFEKNMVMEKTKDMIKLNLKYLKSIKNNYLETNYKDLTLIKAKLDSFQI